MTIISDDRTHKDRTIVMPADWVPGPRQGSWTYEAYTALPEDGNRYEIVQGVLMMTPAPEPAHQGIAEEINSYLRSQILHTKRGLVLTAPIDVVLSKHMTVQPDVLVLLKEHLDRLQKKRIVGAPDLAVEVISPSSATYDRLVKYSVYERAGVPEYWLVNVDEQTIEVFILEAETYRSLGIFQDEQHLISRIVPETEITVSQLFDWTHGLL
jgi:Uma2 family endonuclease